MKCWICGNEATTGEHKTKASDLRALYGSVSQKNPLFLHTDQRRNQKVGSVKANKFKFDALICSHCNNARTAPYDKAWEQLSKFLRDKKPTIKKDDVISLHKIFPGAVSKSMLFVHLFFVKLFGCAIVEHKVPIDISPFSEAILQKKSHPKVFISFGSSSNMGTGLTDIHADNIQGRCAYATWFYLVEPVAVNIIFAEPSENRKGLIPAWHPSTISKRIHAGF